MSDLNNSEYNHQVPKAAPKPFWRRGRNVLLASALLVGGGIVGAAVTGGVNAQQGPMLHGMAFHGGGMGGFGPGGRGHGFFGGGQLDPAKVEARTDRMVRHLAVEIDATSDQTEKLRTIVKGAVKDLVPLHAQIREGRDKAKALLVQPNLTRADIETFRAQQLALVDQASKRVTQALGDASEVLNADQRKKLGEILERRQGRGWGHRGRDRG